MTIFTHTHPRRPIFIKMAETRVTPYRIDGLTSTRRPLPTGAPLSGFRASPTRYRSVA
jgi:hypothetical protein